MGHDTLFIGLRPGLTIAHAQALVPELHIAEATPEEDNEGLARLATWCLRYTPLVAATRRRPDPRKSGSMRALSASADVWDRGLGHSPLAEGS